MKKHKYKYHRTLYNLGDATYKKTEENKLVCEKNKNGFQVSLTFSADEKTHNKAIEDINNILIKTLFK